MKFLLLLLGLTSLHGLTLQEAEMRALQSSPLIQLTHFQSQQNNAQYKQAFLAWFPDVTFESMAAILQKPQKISSFQRQKHLFSNQLTLTQPIFSSDLLGNLRLSRIGKKGGLLGKEMIANDTLLGVRTAYLWLGIAQEEVSLARMRLAYLQKMYEDEEIRLKSGRATPLQVAKAKSAISKEISNQLESRKKMMQARHELSLALHLSPEEEAQLSFGGFPSIGSYPFLTQKQQLIQSYVKENTLGSSFPHLSLFQEEEIEHLIHQAKATRPELKKSSLLVQAAEAKRVQSRIQYLPEISAFVDYGYYQPVNGQFFRQKNDWAGGIQLSWSLFDSLKREVKSEEITALGKAARLTYSLENDKLERVIREDLNELELALFVYQNAQQNLFLAHQMLEESEVQYESGNLSDLQMQEAQLFLATSHFNQIEALSLLFQKYYQLEHDIGHTLREAKQV